jgi:O-methyltransferase
VTTRAEDPCRELYLHLLQRTLMGLTYEDPSRRVPPAVGAQATDGEFDHALRATGADWPATAPTMIGAVRLGNLRACIEQVVADGVPGDVIETGVWRGGACIFMRGVLKSLGVMDRRVWVADSFEGLPPPNPSKYPHDAGLHFEQYRELAISQQEVQRNFERFNLLDDQVRFLEGWFRETLPGAPIEQLAVMRLDGDLYESTMDALTSLYHRLSAGGFVIVDDYFIPACKAAVEDFRAAQGITEEIVPIDWTGVFWRRTR